MTTTTEEPAAAEEGMTPAEHYAAATLLLSRATEFFTEVRTRLQEVDPLSSDALVIEGQMREQMPTLTLLAARAHAHATLAAAGASLLAGQQAAGPRPKTLRPARTVEVGGPQDPAAYPSSRPPVEVFAGGLGSGKTTAAVQWVAGGTATDGFPGWTRVLVVATERQAHHLRGQHDLATYRVLSLAQWGDVRGNGTVPESTEVCYDDAAAALDAAYPGRTAAVTFYGKTWGQQ